MKLTTKLSAVSSALAIAGMLAFSGQVVADTVEADYFGYTGATTSGTINDVSKSGGGGLFKFERTGGTSSLVLLPNVDLGEGSSVDDFIAICLEFNENLNTANVFYDLIELSVAPVDANNSPYAPMGSRATDIATLLGGIYPVFGQSTIGGAAITNSNALALQIAVWEISNEGEESAYNVASGNMKFDAPTAASEALAQGWLDNINNSNQLGWSTLTNLMAISLEGQQDFIVQYSEESDTPSVPIPAAAWLFGSALFGTVAMGRRKQKKLAA